MGLKVYSFQCEFDSFKRKFDLSIIYKAIFCV